MDLKYCSQCCMDGSASEITFDEKGVCCFCHQAQKALKEIEAEKHKLPEIIERIKKDAYKYGKCKCCNGEKRCYYSKLSAEDLCSKCEGTGKEQSSYDCLIGLSGGVDSSTALLLAIKLGLRPLCFSVDTGWNKPEADENIMRMVETLKVPFFRYTIDLKKFKELQGAFIKAGVPNIEIPTDHILMATTYELAVKYGIKYILSGGNVATESIMPASWSYPARDLVHIKDVYKKIMGKKLKGLPVCGLLKWNYYKWIKGIRIAYLLDYLNYNRAESIKLLEKEYGFKDTGEKHCENYFTDWHIHYYLFEKFGYDKRKAHYASLINSGQMTRKEATDLLAERPVYPELGFEKLIWKFPKKSHYDFKTDEKIWNFLATTIRALKKLLLK